MILSMIFNSGENQKVSAQWELLDTPPAQAWRDMLDHAVSNPKETPLSLTDSTFCASEAEAQVKWNKIRASLVKLNHNLANAPLGRLKSAQAIGLTKEIQTLISKGAFGSLDKAFELREIVNQLKDVMFWIDHVKDRQFNEGNIGTAFGQILHIPDPHFAIEFKPEWTPYLTWDIEPGTVYAELTYEDMAWRQVLEFESIDKATDAIRSKRFGSPQHLGSGFIIPFGKDIAAVEADLLEYFYKYRATIQHLDPTFNPMYAVRSSGRIPVAKLKTEIGQVGYPGYNDLTRIESMFKMEVLENWI